VVTIGKAVAGEVPMGAYGVTSTLGHELSAARQVATGRTLFGNPLSAAAAKAALTEVLVADTNEHTGTLGAALADGIEAAIAASGLPWTAIRFGPRSGQWSGPQPRTGAEAVSLLDEEQIRLLRIWLANRGVWEALPGAARPCPCRPQPRTWIATCGPTPSCWSSSPAERRLGAAVVSACPKCRTRRVRSITPCGTRRSDSRLIPLPRRLRF
jgi:hypothetical protein